MTLDQTIDNVAKARTALVLAARHDDDSAALDLAIGNYFSACSLFLRQMAKRRSEDTA